MNNIIINPIEVHLLSSTSAITSNTNVAITPPIIAKDIRIQIYLSVNFFVADLSTESSTMVGFDSP